jgi:hypothetical protein
MKDGNSSKHFPKDFQQATVLDKDDYAPYMRVIMVVVCSKMANGLITS